MKTLLLALLILLSLPLTSFADDAAVSKKYEELKIDFQEPPFWMFSYDELQKLRDSQKKTYLENFLKASKKLPTTSKLTQKELDEAAVWDESWETLMTKIYTDCTSKDVAKACEDVADIRLDALNSHSNQKLENRAANEVAESKKSKSKR